MKNILLICTVFLVGCTTRIVTTQVGGLQVSPTNDNVIFVESVETRTFQNGDLVSVDSEPFIVACRAQPRWVCVRRSTR